MPLAESILSGVATAATTTATNEGIKNAGGLSNLLNQHSMILIGAGAAIGATALFSKKKMPLVDVPKNWGIVGGLALAAAGVYGMMAPPSPPPESQ